MIKLDLSFTNNEKPYVKNLTKLTVCTGRITERDISQGAMQSALTVLDH